MKKSKTKSDQPAKENKDQSKPKQSEQGGSIYRDTDWKSEDDRCQGPRGDTW